MNLIRINERSAMKHKLLLTVICLLLTLMFLPPVEAAQTCFDSIIATAPDDSFSVHADGTVTDNRTGLMWMRCSLGQEWNGKTCTGQAIILPWAAALKEAAKHVYAGHGDWRLPNKNELESIVEGRCVAPAINDKIFPATPAAYYWSSSPYAGVSHGAWSIDFGYGSVNASVKSGKINLRLVRDGE